MLKPGTSTLKSKYSNIYYWNLLDLYVSKEYINFIVYRKNSTKYSKNVLVMKSFKLILKIETFQNTQIFKTINLSA